MHIVYNLFTYLLIIPFSLYWIIKGISNRAYFDRLGQRFGLGFPEFSSSIWIHAVSVGEVQASSPLVFALLKKFPKQQIIITTVTPTGASRVAKLFGESVQHCYVPFEFPNAINSFFKSIKPKAAMIIETEIWPNLFRGCGLRSIPLILVSARISHSSVPSYRKLLPLIRETLSHGIIIAAQSQADANRFLELGANIKQTYVTGNIKFDIESDRAILKHGRELKNNFFKGRQAWIAASTHEGEERIILDAHRILLKKYPDLLLIIAPRHPERFSGVKKLIKDSLFKVSSRTDNELNNDHEVFLLDTMGEVPLFLAVSDISFIGGSLVPIGGHNILEPAAQGLPIFIGPHFYNSEEVVREFIKNSACKVVEDKIQLATDISDLLINPDKAKNMGQRSLKLVSKNKGSTERLLALAIPILENNQKSKD